MQAPAAVIEPFERQIEHAEPEGTISFNGSSATKQSQSFDIDKRNMETVGSHFKSNKLTNLSAELHSFDDNFQVRIQTMKDPRSLHQNEACSRKRRRSGSRDKIQATDLPIIMHKHQETPLNPVSASASASASFVPHESYDIDIDDASPSLSAALFLPPKPQPSATIFAVKNMLGPTVDTAPFNQLASILAKRQADTLPTDPETKLKQRRMVQNVMRAAWNTKTKDWSSKFRPTLQTLAQVLSETKANIGIPTLFRCSHLGHADTYGEATPALITHMMQQYGQLVSEETEKKSTFVDLGSGHGGLVCQMASFRKFHICFGIEYEDERASWAYRLANDFCEQLQRRSYGFSNIQIDFGDFFKSDTTLAFLRQASLVWVNNVKFAEINFQLLTLLDKSVPKGCVVVSFVSFLTRQTYRNETGFQAVSDILVEGAADWTGTPQKVYVMQKRR